MFNECRHIIYLPPHISRKSKVNGKNMFSCICMYLTFLASTVHAWGNDGHQIIAQIAQTRLSSTAQKRITDILGGSNMSSVATWADSVRKTPEWSWSAPLHFINVPDRLFLFIHSGLQERFLCCWCHLKFYKTDDEQYDE